MCGRAKLPQDVSEIKLDLAIDWDELADYRPSWNAAPTAKLPVVISNNGARTLTAMRWGLVPSWANDPKIGRTTFNARAESIASRTAFRGAWRAGRRCLVIADAYYEWRQVDKQPFAIALGNRGPMIFAGLWEEWRTSGADSFKSFTIITTAANDLLKPLHDRMPVLLAPDAWPVWLGETKTSEAALQALLKPYPSAAMTFWPVDHRLGDVENDSPDLFAPQRPSPPP